MPLNPQILAKIRAASAAMATKSAQEVTQTTEVKETKEQNVQTSTVIKQSQPEASSSGKSALTQSIAALQAASNKSASSTSSIQSIQQGSSTTGTNGLTATQIRFQQVSDSITELTTALLKAHPQMPVLLNSIWKTLITYPECVTLLSEEQVEQVVAGLEKHTDTDLAAITIKNATKAGKKGPVSAADLGF